MKLIVLCSLMICGGSTATEGPGQLVSIDRWKEDTDSMLDRDDFVRNANTIYDNRHFLQPENFPEQAKRIAAEEISVQPRFVPSRSHCSCETHYEMLDLGEGHYPRFLTASRCKPNTCHKSCRLLHYMVHVLRQRDLNGLSEGRYSEDNVFPEAPLPESLRQNWQLKPLSVAVACISSSDIRRN